MTDERKKELGQRLVELVEEMKQITLEAKAGISLMTSYSAGDNVAFILRKREIIDIVGSDNLSPLGEEIGYVVDPDAILIGDGEGVARFDILQVVEGKILNRVVVAVDAIVRLTEDIIRPCDRYHPDIEVMHDSFP